MNHQELVIIGVTTLRFKFQDLPTTFCDRVSLLTILGDLLSQWELAVVLEGSVGGSRPLAELEPSWKAQASRAGVETETPLNSYKLQQSNVIQ